MNLVVRLPGGMEDRFADALVRTYYEGSGPAGLDADDWWYEVEDNRQVWDTISFDLTADGALEVFRSRIDNGNQVERLRVAHYPAGSWLTVREV